MTTRIGVIGCGFIAALHSRSLKALAAAGLVDAAVVATCDPDRSRAEAFARAHRADLATADPAEVLAAVDAVYVCTPTAGHPALVAAAAEAGLAVFCEKPLATTLAGAEAMAAVVAGRDIPAQVGLVLRTSPAYGAVVDLVRSGRLGRPQAVSFRDDQYFPTQGQYGSSWRGDVAVAGGGTLLEHSIHDLDVLRWLLGEATSVMARTANFAGHPGVEDVAVATIAFTDEHGDPGATASLVSVWHQVLSRPSTRWLEVLCEHGVVAAPDEHAAPLRLHTSAGVEELAVSVPPWTAELPGDERWRAAVAVYAPQSLAFLEALRQGRAPAPGFDVAVAAHRLADAVYRSAAAEGAPVRPGSGGSGPFAPLSERGYRREDGR
ncbi:MAG: Gfo/Idh/MocA family oxidoreductase [Acidimicrobiia bacterium]|nr:Gfo/Idh/MocA family oxidoreductase [Acidimicrobiia bacterium]